MRETEDAGARGSSGIGGDGGGVTAAREKHAAGTGLDAALT